MNNFSGKIYGFDRFQLDAGERLLFDGIKTIPLAPKVFDTLLLLVENAGRILSKERMLKEIWEDSFVEENNLAVACCDGAAGDFCSVVIMSS